LYFLPSTILSFPHESQKLSQKFVTGRFVGKCRYIHSLYAFRKKIPETAAGKPVSDEFPLNELTVEALRKK